MNPDFQNAILTSSHWTMTPRLVDPEGIEPSGYRCERRLCPSVQEPKLGTPGWNRTTVIAVSGRYSTIEIRVHKLERSMGIEPTFEGWEPPSLPLTYDRKIRQRTVPCARLGTLSHPRGWLGWRSPLCRAATSFGRGGGNRTHVLPLKRRLQSHRLLRPREWSRRRELNPPHSVDSRAASPDAYDGIHGRESESRTHIDWVRARRPADWTISL